MSTRKYANTLFDTPTFARLMASDPKGVRAEAKARGPESKLARKVKAHKAPAKVTRTVTPKVTRPALSPEKVLANIAFAEIFARAGLREAKAAYGITMRALTNA